MVLRHDDYNLIDIAEYLAKLETISKVRLLPYNKLVESKIERMRIEDKIGGRAIQSSKYMKDAADIFQSHGFNVKIGG